MTSKSNSWAKDRGMALATKMMKEEGPFVAASIRGVARDKNARRITKALDAARLAGYRAAVLTNGSTPYPLLDVLRILADAADHKHEAHACDADGWEVVCEARSAAREIIRELVATVGADIAEVGQGWGGTGEVEAARLPNKFKEHP